MANDESKEGADNAGLTVDGVPVSENLSEADIESGARIDGLDSLPEQRRKDLETNVWESTLLSLDTAFRNYEKCIFSGGNALMKHSNYLSGRLSTRVQ